jgi:outer membrane protein assembly factor BamA
MPTGLLGQYSLEIFPSDAFPSFIKSNPKREFKDSTSVLKFLQQFQLDFHAQAYLTAGYDSIRFEKKQARAYFYTGDLFTWSYLKKGNVPEMVLSKTNFHARDYRKKPFNYKQLTKLEIGIVRWSENNGFPFASIQLDSFKIQDQQLHATMKWEKGPLIYFDSLKVEGKIKVKQRFLARHLKIYKDNLYSQERIDQIPVLLRELPYIVSMRAPMVSIRDNKARVTLFLKDKKISSADGIIGFLPNESSNNRLLITGELNLNLRNLFGTGKTLQLEWKKIKEQTQTLDLNYVHPKLVGSPLDVKFNFNLFKQDSSFLTVNRKLIFSNRIGNYSKVNFISGLRTSRILASAQIIDTTKLRFSDYNHYVYGLGYEYNRTDDYYNPHRGWVFSAQGTLGNKIIRKNSEVPETFYSSLQLNSQQWNVETSLERYTRVGKKSVLLSRIMAARLFNNSQNVFFNDLYRIGGLRTLRGFNENTFFAATYGVATLEYRFYTDETSYLLLFADQGYMQNPISPIRETDFPIGFGAGLSFSTPAGMFNFIYSLGRSADSKISLNLSKIHFGITSRF